jgi:photosynthetic reaction center cytochrome c subunit
MTRRRIGAAVSVCAALALTVTGAAKARGQAAPQGGAQGPPSPADGVVLSEQYFKNIQALKGIPVDEFMDTMGMFAAATGMNCVDCHVGDAGGDWAKYATDTAFKQTTRRMVAMVNTLNGGSFGGRPLVTCFTCHRGLRAPATLPSLDLQYGDPPPVDPDQVTRTYPGTPTSDQILDAYLQALGGAQRVAGITSITGKGSYRAYDDFQLSPFDFYAKAPDQRTTIQHSDYGDMTITYDGKNAWMAAPRDIRPYPVVQYSGGNLDGARVDAILEFPGRLKQALTNWKVGPESSVDDQDVHIVQATTPSGFLVKLYFDVKTGLLLRSVRYSNSPVGRVPVRVDYSDYRAVSGVKVPFKRVATWTDGRTVFQLDSVQVNTAVDASRFAKPRPPAPPAAR